MSVFYEKTFQITTREEGRFSHVKPSDLLMFLQESAAEAALAIGVGREQIVEQSNAFWMLLRIRYDLYRPLKLWEKVTVRTWHRGSKGLLMYRDFDLSVGDEKVGEAVSVWAVANVDTHEIMRLSVLKGIEGTDGGQLCKDIKLNKFRMPEEMTQIDHRRMYPSCCDVNGHVNNTRYADLATDAIDLYSRPGEPYISSLTVAYEKEMVAGDEIDLFTGEKDGAVYVRGRDAEGHNRFEAKLTIG